MATSTDAYRKKRLELARIAGAEGRLALGGNENMAGEAIEKYLAVFREAFNRNGGYTKYDDKNVGYPWCCAFVYYCCRQAGFDFQAKPIPAHRWTFGAVSVWYDWAILPENGFYIQAGDGRRLPEAGDIVLFNRLIEDKDLDHMGIVVGVATDRITTAEGNVYNRAGIFGRPLGTHINGYVRLTRF